MRRDRSSAVQGRWRLAPAAKAVGRAGAVLPFERWYDDGDDGTPAGALRRLLAGNRRFVQGRAWSAYRDGARREHSAPSQAPFAVVIGCSDSPVPHEVLFDQAPGDLVVMQLAGNVVTPDEVASLEYAAAVSEVRAIVVLGHTPCGAVEAALTHGRLDGQLGMLFQHIVPGLDPARRDPLRAVEDNAAAQGRKLLEGSAALKERVACGRLMVAAAVYDVAAGTVRVVA